MSTGHSSSGRGRGRGAGGRGGATPRIPPFAVVPVGITNIHAVGLPPSPPGQPPTALGAWPGVAPGALPGPLPGPPPPFGSATPGQPFGAGVSTAPKRKAAAAVATLGLNAGGAPPHAKRPSRFDPTASTMLNPFPASGAAGGLDAPVSTSQGWANTAFSGPYQGPTAVQAYQGPPPALQPWGPNSFSPPVLQSAATNWHPFSPTHGPPQPAGPPGWTFGWAPPAPAAAAAPAAPGGWQYNAQAGWVAAPAPPTFRPGARAPGGGLGCGGCPPADADPG